MTLSQKISLSLHLGVSRPFVLERLLLVPSYSPQAFSKALSRMQDRGDVVFSSGGIRLTERGRRMLDAFPVLYFAGSSWSGQWTLILFDVPEAKRSTRDAVRTTLRDRSCVQYHHSLWLSPHHPRYFTDISQQIRDAGGRFECLHVSHLQDMEATALAHTQWPLLGQHAAYLTIEREWDALLQGGVAIDALLSAIPSSFNSFLEAFSRDPGLPEELCPQGWARQSLVSRVWQFSHLIEAVGTARV